MKTYKVVAVLWQDHILYSDESPNVDVNDTTRPTLSVGILYEKTKDFIKVIHNLSHYPDRDEADFMVIYRSCILGDIQEYGTIELNTLR